MVKTYGLTHMAIGVRDPARAYAFYRAVLGMEAVYTESDFIQAQTPGTRDVLVFERAPARAGRKGGIAHFGFRLTRRKTSRTLCRPWSPPEDAYSVTASSARVSLICSARTPTATKWRSGTSCRRRSIRNHGLSEIGHGPGVPNAPLAVRGRERKLTSLIPYHLAASDHLRQLRSELFDDLRTTVKRRRGVVQQDDLPCAVLIE